MVDREVNILMKHPDPKGGAAHQKSKMPYYTLHGIYE
jgi:hypothetical protein